MKKKEEIQLKLAGETLFLRPSSAKAQVTYEEKLREYRQMKKYAQY